jgi:hypothetical protein
MSSVEAYEGYPKYLIEVDPGYDNDLNYNTIGFWLTSFATIEPQQSYPNYDDNSPATGTPLSGLGAYEANTPSLDTAILEGIKTAVEGFDWSAWGQTPGTVTVVVTKYAEDKTTITL